GIKAHIYVIILGLLFIIKSQVADGAVLHEAFFHMHGMQVFISMYESDILQQLIEYSELFRIFLRAFGVFDKMDDEVGSRNSFFPLKKRELRMIAEPVGEQTGMFVGVYPEQGRTLLAIVLRMGLSENKRQYDQ